MSQANHEIQEETLVDDLTRLLRQDSPLAPEIDAMAESAGWVGLIRRLSDVLVPLEPRAEFVDELRHELLNQRGRRLRWRGMPARVRIAAALALIAGFGLLLSRRLFGADESAELGEETIAAAH